MNNYKVGLLTTLILGIFILIGAFLGCLTNRKQKIVSFSIGLAFGVIVMLIFMDLIPDVIEYLGLKYIYVFVIGILGGFLLLKLLDSFIPDHDDDNSLTNKEAKDNLIHIGIITSIAIILHNIIEGMAVYSSVIADMSLGLSVTLGIGFHNIPMGMVIASSFHQSNQNGWKTAFIMILISLSTFAGGLFLFFLNIYSVPSVILGLLLSITLGMLVYIVYEELFPRIKNSKNFSFDIAGILIGVVLMLITLFF